MGEPETTTNLMSASDSTERLLEISESLIASHDYSAAIVIAQMAIELQAEFAFVALIHLNLPASHEALIELVPDRSFMSEGTRDLWFELTGDRISKAPAWKRYHKEHIEARNVAAHSRLMGRKVKLIGKADAENSVVIVRQMLEHLRGVVAAEINRLIDGGRTTVKANRGLRAP